MVREIITEVANEIVGKLEERATSPDQNPRIKKIPRRRNVNIKKKKEVCAEEEKKSGEFLKRLIVGNNAPEYKRKRKKNDIQDKIQIFEKEELETGKKFKKTKCHHLNTLNVKKDDARMGCNNVSNIISNFDSKEERAKEILIEKDDTRSRLVTSLSWIWEGGGSKPETGKENK